MTNDPITSLGYWLRRRRLALDLTQAELAARVGCSESAIRKIESDERRPSAQVAQQLATVLGIAAKEQALFLQVARGDKSPERLAALDAPTFTPTARSPTLPLPTTAPPITNSIRPLALRLPSPTTACIGRDGERHEIAQILSQPACRVLTIIGPGGIGKTRLALAVAADQDAAYNGQVYFVGLAALLSPKLLAQTVASTIGFDFTGQGEPERQLLAYLRNKRLLLLLDNVEHLLHPAGDVAAGEDIGTLLAEWSERAPDLKILATSREPLGLPGEWLFTLQGLTVPPAGNNQPPAGEVVYGSVALAVQCARRVQPDFAPSPATYADLARICRLVDGMPLGIELATAWGRTLSYREIAVEIENNIDFLAANRRDLPARHRSLRATFDYSWQLLNADERRVLSRLTVFVGTFSREATRTVAQATLPVLAALVAKSLVRRMDATVDGAVERGGTRYELHELVRQFAVAKGQADPVDQGETQARHALYFAQLALNEATTLPSANQKAALQRLTLELANIRQAWGWLVTQGAADWLLRLAWPLWYFFELRNAFQEGEALFQQGQEALRTRQRTDSEPLLTSAWAALLTHQAFFAFRQGRTEQALSWLTAAVAQLRRDSAAAALIDALWAYGAVCWFLGKFEAAATALHEALTLSRTHPLPWQQAVNPTFLGIVLYEQGAYTESYQLLHEGLTLARALGDPRPIAFAGSFLSRTAQALGRYGEMMELLHEGLRLARESGDRFGMGVALEQLALGSHALGQLTEGSQFLAEGVQLYREIGDSWSLARLLTYAGNLALEQGDHTAAEQAFREALHLAVEANVPPNALDALVGLAALRTQQGDDLAALVLVETVLHHPAATQVARQRTRQLQQALTARLSADQVAMAQKQAEAARWSGLWTKL